MNSLTQAGLSLAAENQRMVGRLTCYELCGEVLWCNLRHRLRWRSMSRRLWSECSEDHSDILQVRDMLLKAFAHGSKRRRGPPAVPVVCVAAGRAGRGEQRAVCRPLLMPRSDFRTLPLCVPRPCGASQYPSCGPVLRQQVLLLQKALRRRPQDERESRARLHPGLSAEVLSSRECPGDLRREVPKLQGHCLSRCALPCVAVPCASCLRADRSEAMTTEGTEP